MTPPRTPAPSPATGSKVGAVLCAAGLLASCAAHPGPPPLVEPEHGDDARTAATTTTSGTTTPAAPNPTARTQVQVGVDPVRNGLNPHLVADESESVRSVAKLVLPSAFVGGVRNPDVLRAATQLATTPGPDVAMTVRYIIADEAQWSDGTPITGADFAYLWRGMTRTPGVVDPAGYRAISQVRIQGGFGKVVDVDFSAPVRDWRSLFDFLLPSHVLAADASDFAGALNNTIPASAGRYMVANVDRGRGTITLNRNDRFWGANPAQIDVLTLNGVRDTTQTADQLRVGQVAFVDKAPDETSGTVFPLVPGVQTRLVDSPRTLGATLSATSPLLATDEARAELRSLIDVPLIARIAAGRSSDLRVADHGAVREDPPAMLPRLVEGNRPLRVGADPADPQAAAAARSLVDLFASRGVPAQVVSTDMQRMAGEGLPSGELDVVVGWSTETGSAANLAGRIACPPEKYRAGNLAGLCTPATDALAADVLAGRVPATDAPAAVAGALDSANVWVPLLAETRLWALTGGIVGPDPSLAAWPDGLASAPAWRVGPAPAASATPAPDNQEKKQ